MASLFAPPQWHPIQYILPSPTHIWFLCFTWKGCLCLCSTHTYTVPIPAQAWHHGLMIQRDPWSIPQSSLQMGHSPWEWYCVVNCNTQSSISNWLGTPCHSGSLRRCFFLGMCNGIGQQAIVWWYTPRWWKGSHLWSLWIRDWYVASFVTYKLSDWPFKVMVIKWNACPGGPGNLSSFTQACGLGIGPLIVRLGSNIIWLRFMNIVPNWGIQWGGERLWNLLAEHLGNSKKPSIWLLSHTSLKICSCFLVNIIITSLFCHWNKACWPCHCSIPSQKFGLSSSTFIKWKRL